MDAGTIAERSVGDVMILSPHGRVVIDEGETRLASRIDALLSSGRSRIVVDLGGVSYVDSAGVGALVAGYRRARAAGGDVKLAAVPAAVAAVLRKTGLDRVFEILDDDRHAIAAFGPDNDGAASRPS